MSHVVDLEVSILNLELLAEAAKECGMELVRDQKTYRWYGRHVGDYPMPAGFTHEDLGKCDHVLRVKGNRDAYEIGIVRKKEGKGFTLLFDFWSGGFGLEKAAGKQCATLLQQYGLAGLRKSFAKQGFKMGPTKVVDGKLVGTMVAA